MNDAPGPRGVVGLLTAQAFAFGTSLALLIIPANAIFLDAYGSEWLPATYIASAIFGSAAAALIARAARRTRLVRVATPTLAGIAAAYLASWLVLVAGGVWASAVLLVLFPLALQVGFIFIGGQAGRLLDVRQMKERFPRVVSGFAAGFLVGGLLGIPLLDLLGSTKQLLLATTAVQLAFLAGLLATERRFPEVLAAPSEGAPTAAAARPPLRTLVASGLVLLLLVYQLLSAMGSQVVDFLLFDRASAHYSGDELTRFLSWYTAATNLADIAFLALLAGPLMRRFGLRLGLVLNPAVVAGLLAVMAVVAAGAGSAAFSLLVLAGALRIGDVTTTDGTTRTSLNAAYQVVPLAERLAVQAVVEGIGMPMAIGVTGVLLLALNLLHLGTGAVIAFGLVLAVAWTAIAVAVYGSYRRALREETRRRTLLEGVELPREDPALRKLLRSDDPRDVRLGLDLLAGAAEPPGEGELRRVAAHGDPELRAQALAQLAAGGDQQAAAELAGLVDDLAGSHDATERRAAAVALGAPPGVAAIDRTALAALLADDDAGVLAAALDAVAHADGSDPDLVGRVVAALADRRTAGPATAALRRLGVAAAPPLRAALAGEGRPRPALVRAAAAAAAEFGGDVLVPALEDDARAVVLTALAALADADARDVVPSDALDRVFRDAAEHAGRALAARRSLDSQAGPLERALDDETELARGLVVAVLSLRHGPRVRDAVRVVDHAEGQQAALGVEALDVTLSREEAAVAIPLVRRDLTSEERAAALGSVALAGRTRGEWIADIRDDPDRVWRSSWLALCACSAAGAERP